MRVVGALFCLILISGCSEEPVREPLAAEPGSASTSDPSSPTSLRPPAPTEPGAPGFVDVAFWSDCKGFRTSVAVVRSMHQLPPGPDDWEERSPPLADFDDRFYECSRLSWGGFERGPVVVLLELAGDMGFPPEQCSGESATLLRQLGTIWFDDPEVAAYAREVYKMPAFYGDFSVTRQTMDGVITQKWTWSTPGAASSNVTFPDVEVPTNPGSHVTRVFWFPESQVYAFDWLEEWQVDSLTLPGTAFRPAAGIFESPMLFATSGDQRQFVGRSERYGGMNATASFHRFGDSQCESPIV